MKAKFSRRKFLTGTTTAAALGATIFELPQVLQGGQADPEDPYRGLPIGIQSYSLRKYNTLQAVGHAQRMGLHYMEFYGRHFSLDSTAEQIKEMKLLLREAKIAISAHGVNRFTKNHEANQKIFEFAKQAGIRNITANPQPDSFDSLERLVAEFDIRICIHNHGPGALYDKLGSVEKAVRDRHKLIGACIDTGHVIRSGEDPVKWIHQLGPRVLALHIKDVAQPQKRTHDVVIGTGHLDVVGMFKAMGKVKFPADGSLSLEYESNPDNPIADIEQCLVVAREAIAKALG